MDQSSADVLGLDWRCEMSQARAALPNRVLQGNVDTSILFGTQQQVRQAAEQCMQQAGSHHILNLGDGVWPDLKEENVGAFVQAAKEYQRQPGAARELVAA